MKKLKDIGFDNFYVVQVFSSARPTKANLLETFQTKYDPEIFPLYSSYSQAKNNDVTAKEVGTDKRGNLLNRPYIKYGIPLSILGLWACYHYMNNFFHPKVDSQKPVIQSTAVSSSQQIATPYNSPKPEPSTKWRVIGNIRTSSGLTFLITDGSSTRYIFNPPSFKLGINSQEIILPNGDIATSWNNLTKEKGIL